MASTPRKRSSYDAGFESAQKDDKHASNLPDGRPLPRISKARACECFCLGINHAGRNGIEEEKKKRAMDMQDRY